MTTQKSNCEIIREGLAELGVNTTPKQVQEWAKQKYPNFHLCKTFRNQVTLIKNGYNRKPQSYDSQAKEIIKALGIKKAGKLLSLITTSTNLSKLLPMLETRVKITEMVGQTQADKIIEQVKRLK